MDRLERVLDVFQAVVAVHPHDGRESRVVDGIRLLANGRSHERTDVPDEDVISRTSRGGTPKAVPGLSRRVGLHNSLVGEGVKAHVMSLVADNTVVIAVVDINTAVVVGTSHLAVLREEDVLGVDEGGMMLAMSLSLLLV